MPHPKGGYKNAAGQRIPGVTTICGRFKDSGALIYWAWEQGSKGIDFRDIRDKAATAGTLAHDIVEAHIRGVALPEIPAEYQAQVRTAFDAYLTWEKNNSMIIVETEPQLVSEHYQYGGTPDAIAYVGEDLCLVDWKTSNGVYGDHVLQLAAYAQLWDENHPEAQLTGGFHLCRFAKEHADFAHHYWPELDDAWEMFKYLRAAYDLDKKVKARV